MNFPIEKRNCSDCGKIFDAHRIEWNGREVFRQERCEKCIETAWKRFEDAEKRKIAEKQTKARKEAFKSICPPLYQNTDPLRLHPQFRDAAINWRYGPRGLGLVGLSGRGKTRAAYMLLKRMASDGRKVEVTNATELSRLCIAQFSDDKELKKAAEKKLKSIKQAEVLLLDDIGEQRVIEYSESELYAVLEHRTTQMLPTIWTANAKRPMLIKMFSEDRGKPIMRRLTEFSEVISVWKDKQR